MLYAKKIAQGKGVVIPEEAMANRADRLEPKREAPQARSQDRLQAGGISCASIDGVDEVVSETESSHCCRLHWLPRSQFGYGYAAADSTATRRSL